MTWPTTECSSKLLHRKKRELATSLLDESHASAALRPDDMRDLLA
jgi:hypothetical protein